MAWVEYLFARGGVPERRGTLFDYVLAGDGVWLQTENERLWARVPVATGSVRGLEPLGGVLELEHGRIPQRVWEEAVQLLYVGGEERWEYQHDAGRPRERAAYVHPVEAMVAIRWEAGMYRVVKPRQEAGGTHVCYEPVPGAVVELHSHHRMRAYFSPQDDSDEQGLGVYGVIGRLHTERPEVVLRLGAYGYWLELPWGDVFEGEHAPFRDARFDERLQEEQAADDIAGTASPMPALASVRGWLIRALGR